MPHATSSAVGREMPAVRNLILMLVFMLTFLCGLPLHAAVWTRLADVPTPRGGSAACVVDGRIYLIGGTTATAIGLAPPKIVRRG